MIDYRRLNRFATIAILPVMLVSVVLLSRHASNRTSAATNQVPPEGILVAANLRDDNLVFHNLKTGDAETLQLAGPPHELLATDGRIYVTLGRGNAVDEVTAAGTGILRTLPLDGEPHGLALAGTNLLVTLDTGAQLLTIDRTSFAVTGRTPTGDTPHIVATDGHDIYVVASRANQVTDATTGRSLPAGQMPEGLAIAGDDLVTADNVSGTLTIVRRSDFSPAGTISVGGGPVRAVALDDHRVLVTLNEAGRLAVVDLAKRVVEREITVDARPDGICFSPSGHYVGVASNASGTVDILRTCDWSKMGAIPGQPGLGSCLWLPAH